MIESVCIMWEEHSNFQNGRLRMLGDGKSWEHIDQVHGEVIVEVKLVS